MGKGATSMEAVAQRMTQYLWDACVDPDTGDREIVLARFFKTHSYSDLHDDLRSAARSIVGKDSLPANTKCLVLLGTTGIEPQWNSREQSLGHKAIPLVNEESVSGIPMIAQLIRQFGLPIAHVIHPAPELLMKLDEKTYNVFHVEEAAGSPYIPAQQQFVLPFGVRSVLGFGGMLPSGNLFAVILFARSHIPRSASDAFRTIALSVKTAILPFEDHAVFQVDEQEAEAVKSDSALPNYTSRESMLRSKAAALEDLGNVYDQMVIEQSRHLEDAVRDLAITNRQLAEEIDNRTQIEAEREKLHEQLLSESRRAGMAEIATGVLHNVGNVLNSVNVSASLAQERIQRLNIEQLGQAAKLMERHEEDLATFMSTDPKGRQLPQFLRVLATHLAAEKATAIKELRSLIEKVGHINSIIATQQAYASSGGVLEDVSVDTTINDVLAIHNDSFHRHQIVVIREDADLPPIVLDKHKLMQILVNLTRNGIDALIGSDASEKSLKIKTSATQDGRVEIAVTDNGTGIDPDDIRRIFTFGFTTKKRGHGFGLHSCANAAKEMGGNLTVQSAGLTQGATFTLDLPLIRSARGLV